MSCILFLAFCSRITVLGLLPIYGVYALCYGFYMGFAPCMFPAQVHMWARADSGIFKPAALAIFEALVREPGLFLHIFQDTICTFLDISTLDSCTHNSMQFSISIFHLALSRSLCAY